MAQCCRIVMRLCPISAGISVDEAAAHNGEVLSCHVADTMLLSAPLSQTSLVPTSTVGYVGP